MSGLGYGPTAGWSGSDTSRERAEEEAESGVAQARLARALELIDLAGPWGLTWRELGDLTGWHHGQSSGALSNLHKLGQVCRLRDARDRCKPYVTAAHVGGREVEPFGRQAPLPDPVLTSALERARGLHRVQGGPLAQPQASLWPTLEDWVGFWRAVAKVVAR